MNSNQNNLTFGEILAENLRLKIELNFANKCLDVLNKMRHNLNQLMSLQIRSNTVIFSEEVIRIFINLEEEYNNILTEKQNTETNKKVIILRNTRPLIVRQIKQPLITANQPINDRQIEGHNKYVVIKPINKSSANNQTNDTTNSTQFKAITENDSINTQSIEDNNQTIIKLEDNPLDSCNNPGEFEKHRGRHNNIIYYKTRLTYDKQVFKCLINSCDKYFDSLTLLSKHQKDSHQNNRLIKNQNYTRSFKCDYPDCGKLFIKSFPLRAHIMSWHLNECQFKCDFSDCGKSYRSKEGLTFHQLKHKDIPLIKCDFKGCAFATNSKQHFERHKRSAQSTQQFVCDVKQCGNRFKTKQSLETHQRIHKDVPRVVCPECGKLVKEYLIQGHIFNHSKVANLFCEWKGCHFKCKVKRDLENHKNAVHLCQRNYLCDYHKCGKRFKTKNTLAIHKKSHFNDRPKVCEWPGCEFRGMTSGHIRVHYRTHTKEKPYSCEWPGCEYRCAFGPNMKKHLKFHQKD